MQNIYVVSLKNVISYTHANELDCICHSVCDQKNISYSNLKNPIMWLTFITFFLCNVIVGYGFLTNGQSSSSLTGTESNRGLDDVIRDLTSLRGLLLQANQKIFSLGNQLAVANQEISSLKNENIQHKAEIDELRQNQTKRSAGAGKLKYK